MGDATDFITSFHSLEGDLIGERKKNFYKLITRPSLFSNKEDLNDVLQRLEPKTYQESIFALEALIYFKRTEQLKEIMKGGNQMFATKILKQTWFFEEAFKDMEAEMLVNEFFPHLSYVVCKKFLNGISKSWKENKMDELYDALEKYYGLTSAVDILHHCSLDKIKIILENNEIKFRPNQVLHLFKRSGKIFESYINHFNQINKTIYDEAKVIKYVALKDPKLLMDLEKSEKIRITCIGKRTTKSIMQLLKDEISRDVKRYIGILNKPVFVRKFSPDFKSVYKQIFPGKFRDVSWYSCDIVKYYPKKRRWDLFFTTCTAKFPNKTLTDVLSMFNSSITNFQPPKEIVYKWANMKYEKRESNFIDFLKYFPTSKGIEILKEKVNITSDKTKRHDLLLLMIETCHENKDMNALEEVLQYISVRHRNEEASFRRVFLSKINNFKLTELNEVHWNYIFEQVQILIIQKDFSFYWQAEIIHRYLEFLFKNKKEYKKVINSYMSILDNDSFRTTLDLKNAPIEKEIYSEICRIFPNFIKKDSENYKICANNLISKIITFSMDNKDFCIQIKSYPHFVDLIADTIKKTGKHEHGETETLAEIIIYNETFPEYSLPFEQTNILEKFYNIIKEYDSTWPFRKLIQNFVLKKNRADLGNQLLKIYLEKLLVEISEDTVISWLLRNEPKLLEPYFETVLKCSLDGRFSLDNKLLRQYSHFNFDTKAKKYCMEQLELTDKTECTFIQNILHSLFILLSTEDFIEIVEKRYLPKKDKLDLEDEEMRDLYQIQSKLLTFLAKVPEPYKILPTVMKFARGDFLKCALPALYSAFYNSPRRILYPYVERLSKQAVSARKHAIFLSCALLDKKYATNLLQNTNESNISSQKHLFSATLKYFLKNPSHTLLLRVIDTMNTIDKNDIETLDSLRNVYIPAKYRHLYIEKCWSFYENLESSGIKINEYLNNLLEHMCKDILLSLSKEFVSYILSRYFSVQTKERLSYVNPFVIKVLKNRESEQDENFKLVYETVLKLKQPLKNEFFNSFIEDSYEKNVKLNFIHLFTDYWNKSFTIIQSLQEHIALKLLLIRLESPDMEKFANRIIEYLHELISELGFLVVCIFKEQLVTALTRLDLKDRLYLYLAILKQTLDPNVCVLIIQILDKPNEDDDDDDDENKEVYKNIKDILKHVDIPIVNAYFKSYFTDNN